MKISLVSMNLSSNCTNRAVALARALKPHFGVEVVGAQFSENRWLPLQDLDIPIRGVPGYMLPGFVATLYKLNTLIDGNVIIACKPRAPSFGAALIKRWRDGTPVILDVDDDELAQTKPGQHSRFLTRLRHANGYDLTRVIDRYRNAADGVFCVSEYLRDRYGGVIVPHGLDADSFSPDKYDRRAVRDALGLGQSSIVFGFIGSPQEQKGVDLLAHVLAAVGDPRVRFLIVGGSPEDGFVADLLRQYGSIIKVMPMQPLARLPELLVAVDAVALPQRRVPESFGQMPAKLTDAMAMGKPIIASALADIPKYLNGCGLLVEPDSFDDLMRQVRWLLANPQGAIEMGQRARQRFLKELTLESMARAMVPEIDRVMAGERPGC